MFQLFDLIIRSPIGAYLAHVAESVAYLILVASDCEECGFNDLGKLLFGGLILAVLVGVSVSLWYRRKRDHESASPQFVSIRSSKPNDSKESGG